MLKVTLVLQDRKVPQDQQGLLVPQDPLDLPVLKETQVTQVLQVIQVQLVQQVQQEQILQLQDLRVRQVLKDHKV